MKTVTKGDLIALVTKDMVTEDTVMKKADVEKVINAFLLEVKNAVNDGGTVVLKKFATIAQRTTASRHSGITGEKIPPRQKVKFKVAETWDRDVKQLGA